MSQRGPGPHGFPEVLLREPALDNRGIAVAAQLENIGRAHLQLARLLRAREPEIEGRSEQPAAVRDCVSPARQRGTIGNLRNLP
jgi:hypothetical protein